MIFLNDVLSFQVFLSWLLPKVTSGCIVTGEVKVIWPMKRIVRILKCSPRASWFLKVKSLLYLLGVHPDGILYWSRPLKLMICLSQLGEENWWLSPCDWASLRPALAPKSVPYSPQLFRSSHPSPWSPKAGMVVFNLAAFCSSSRDWKKFWILLMQPRNQES